MFLRDIIADPHASLIYMERYVNKGSPSGFTHKFTTAPPYDPKLGGASFSLPYFVYHNEIELYGYFDFHKYNLFQSLDHTEIPFFIHPDMIEIFTRNYMNDIFLQHRGSIKVAPTANARTVLPIDPAYHFFIKLHYEGCLGRIFRSLPRIKAISGPEMFYEIKNCIDQGISPSRFAVLPEPAAIIKYCPTHNIKEIGLVIREFAPYPQRKGRVLIPFFSLFSIDDKNPNDPYLLTQILRHFQNTLDALLNLIILPILESYIFLVFHRGIIPEINAQNILLEIDDNYVPQRIIYRDMQGFEKDLTIRRIASLCTHFDSFPYKCLNIEEDTMQYYIRHSFSYDFKLGCYIFDELVSVVCNDFNLNPDSIRMSIADIFHSLANGFDANHFHPKDKWYAHDKVLLTETRPYIELSNPRYRRY